MLDSKEEWEVANCKSCNLGKWITECEEKQRNFVSSNAWNNLKVEHEKLHNQVQEYVTNNANKDFEGDLSVIANDIEKSTHKIFDNLDELLEVNNMQ